jgi:hypothetical protein
MIKMIKMIKKTIFKKHFLNGKLFFFLLFFLAAIYSCSDDSIDHVEQYIGAYNVVENCDSASSEYILIIKREYQVSNSVLIENFGGFGGVIYGTINDNNTIIIQDESDNILIEAKGEFNTDKSSISFIYNATNNGVLDNCIALANKVAI